MLWSIFNNDFKKIVTTLHLLERKVDTGKIYKIKKNISKKKNMKYYELRYYNTLNCIKLTEKLIFEIIRNKKIKLKSQKIQGRYYTAMPSSLKDYCIKKFEKLYGWFMKFKDALTYLKKIPKILFQYFCFTELLIKT